MAVLSNAIRNQLHRGLMRYLSSKFEGLAVTKADILAAINAADDWADANASSYNTALPTAFRTTASAGQKALLLAVVCLARFDVAMLRRILGEID